MALRMHVFEIWIGKVHASALVVLLPQANDLFRVAVGKRAQQDSVNHADNCGSGPDSERQRKNARRREAVILGQHAQGETEVLPQFFHRLSYSYRNATMGSTRVARLAGMRQARSATSVNTTMTPTNVKGS